MGAIKLGVKVFVLHEVEIRLHCQLHLKQLEIDSFIDSPELQLLSLTSPSTLLDCMSVVLLE